MLLDRRGRRLWQIRADDHLRDLAPLLLPDAVMVATEEGLVAFDRTDGQLLWRAALGDRANEPIAAAGGRLVVTTTWDGRVVAVDAGTGERVWEVQVGGGILGPAAAGSGLVVTTWEENGEAGVVAIDAATGAIRWNVAVPEGGVSAPAVGDGQVVVVAGDATALSFDVADGTERWSDDVGAPGSSEVPPAARCGGRRVALLTRLAHLGVVDSRTGRPLWSTDPLDAAVRGGPACLGGGVVAAPLNYGGFVVAKSHDPLVVPPPGGLVNGVAAGPGGLLLVGTVQGKANALIAYRVTVR